MILSITSPTQLPGIASQLIAYAGTNRIFVFYGDMGAGKTTFIKSLGKCLGITDAITSPTFSIVNEYVGATGKIYHFDFYRLKDQNEALDMGYEEYFYSGNYCFIEWPEKIPDMLPSHYVSVNIQVLSGGLREITFTKM